MGGKEVLPFPLVSSLKMARGNQTGFTLIEIMVTIVLVSLVTLIVGMALKLAVQAWERGEKEGDRAQVSGAIPSLLEKQFLCAVNTATFAGGAQAQRLPFCGSEKRLSFFTTYAPQGAALQGLVRVTYIFDDEEDNSLRVYMSAVTRKEDLDEEVDPLSEKWGETLDPISRMNGITLFELVFTDKKTIEPNEAKGWKDLWKCNVPSLPGGVMLRLAVGNEKTPRRWIFRLGGNTG